MKRGRPKGPDKVVFKVRVEPSVVERLRACLENKQVCSLDKREPALNVPPSKEAHDATQYLTEISELKAQAIKLAENEDGLMKEVEFWKGRFEKAVDATPDQLSAYWKREALRYKAELGKKGEFDQT